MSDSSKCIKCGKESFLQDSDAGSNREVERLCKKCYFKKGSIQNMCEDILDELKTEVDELSKQLKS